MRYGSLNQHQELKRKLTGPGFVPGSVTDFLWYLGKLVVFLLSLRNSRSSLLHTSMEKKDFKDCETHRSYNTVAVDIHKIESKNKASYTMHKSGPNQKVRDKAHESIQTEWVEFSQLNLKSLTQSQPFFIVNGELQSLLEHNPSNQIQCLLWNEMFCSIALH